MTKTVGEGKRDGVSRVHKNEKYMHVCLMCTDY